jgi:hypothetical protein
MPHPSSYAAVFIPQQKKPQSKMLISSQNIAKSCKYLLPFEGELLSHCCEDFKGDSLGTLYWREKKKDSIYKRNEVASRLSGKDVYGPAIITGLAKGKNAALNFNAEKIVYVHNVYNKLHNLNLIVLKPVKTETVTEKRPLSAFEFFALETKSETKADALNQWELCQDKSIYLEKESDAMERYKAEKADNMEPPRKPRKAFHFWLQSVPKKEKGKSKKDQCQAWHDGDKTQWNKLAEDDKNRYDQEMIDYNAKCKQFKAFQKLNKPQEDEQPKKKQKVEIEKEADSSSDTESDSDEGDSDKDEEGDVNTVS